jgi:uncharacterized protein YbaP (TraB family)
MKAFIKTLVYRLTFSIALFFLALNNYHSQLLWEISGNGLDRKSYLYGTLHVAPAKEFYLNPNVQSVMKNCDVLALEIVVNLKDAIAIAPMMVLENGKNIQDYLNPQEFARFRDYCLNTIKMKEKKFKRYYRLKPFFISSDLLIQQLGKIKKVEKELEKIAKKNKMSVMGLETIEFQMQTINTMSVEDGYKQLMRDLGNEMTEFRRLLSEYKKENLLALLDMMAKSEAETPGFTEAFLNIRNRNWIPVIEKIIKDKAVFVAVGAAHLPGEEGVINLLKKQGYELKAIR